MLRRALPCLVVAACLSVPAAAAATTYTVDPTAPTGCNVSNVCRTIRDANTKVANGDTVSIKDGTYEEAGPITVSKTNVTFKAVTPLKVVVTTNDAQTNTAVFVLGDGTVLDGLVVATQKQGAQAVVAAAKGAIVRNSTLARLGPNNTNAPVLASTSPTGLISLISSIVIQGPTNTGSARPPAVLGNATSSFNILDSLIFAGPLTGAGVVLNGSSPSVAHTITRSQIIVSEATADGVTVTSAPTVTNPQNLKIDSSVISPGPDGTGVNASNQASLTGSAAAVAITGTHATIAGGGKPIALDAGAFGAGPLSTNVADPVTATFDRSIIHGSAPSTRTTHTNLVQASSTATITETQSDTTDVAGPGITLTTATKSTDEQLFANPAGRNYHLRLGAPAIDRGGPQVASESDKDIDQQARVVGNASDQGADELLNLPPKAVITASSTNVVQGSTVTFDGSKSSDPEAGGGIAKYTWDFGDGQTAETTVPTTTHTYDKIGSYTPKLTVTDPQGNVSPAAAGTPIAVTDGTAPTVKITTPGANAKIRIYNVKTRTVRRNGKKVKRRTRTLNRFNIRGSAADEPSGVAKVEIAIRRVSTSRARAAATGCVYLSGIRFVTASCTKPRYFPVQLGDDGFWAFRIRSGTSLKPGRYEISARATDKAGVVSEPAKIGVTLR